MNVYVLSIKVESDNNEINYHCTDIFYSLEEAIKNGKIQLRDICADYYDIHRKSVSKSRLYKFYNNKNLYYQFDISVVSGERKRFNTSNEIMRYFNKNINDIPNYQLYEFLLSLVECENRYYRYDGKLKGGEIMTQAPKLERAFASRVHFSMESCERRNWYIFEYTTDDDYKDLD